MQTLFDLEPYHVEPEPDPNRPTAAKCLELISQAEQAGDMVWLQNLIHWLFLSGSTLYSKSDYQAVFERREQAIKRVASAIQGRAG